MPTMQKTSIRLTISQKRMLARLAEKLQIDQSNVIRLAIARLAEQEGLSRNPK